MDIVSKVSPQMHTFICFLFSPSFRFSQLKSLNLSHNRLGVFPECVCEILTLTELNLSCNSLHTIPVQIGNLQRLLLISTLRWDMNE